MTDNALGKRIKQVRNDRRFTAEQLAERCSINSTYLRQIEGGKKMPSLPVFVDICNAMEVSPDYLLQEDLKTNEISKIKEIEMLWETASPDVVETVLTIIKSVLASDTE